MGWLVSSYFTILLSSPMKAGEGNPQAREEEGKLHLLSMEHSSSLAGIPRMWGLEFHGKATAFTPSVDKTPSVGICQNSASMVTLLKKHLIQTHHVKAVLPSHAHSHNKEESWVTSLS